MVHTALSEIWDTMKISNLKIIEIKKFFFKDIENSLNNIIAENFPKLYKKWLCRYGGS